MLIVIASVAFLITLTASNIAFIVVLGKLANKLLCPLTAGGITQSSFYI